MVLVQVLVQILVLVCSNMRSLCPLLDKTLNYTPTEPEATPTDNKPIIAQGPADLTVTDR